MLTRNGNGYALYSFRALLLRRFKAVIWFALMCTSFIYVCRLRYVRKFNILKTIFNKTAKCQDTELPKLAFIK